AGLCGKPALPALLGRSSTPAGTSGFWVGRSGGCFTVGLLSDREAGFAPPPGDILRPSTVLPRRAAHEARASVLSLTSRSPLLRAAGLLHALLLPAAVALVMTPRVGSPTAADRTPVAPPHS